MQLIGFNFDVTNISVRMVNIQRQRQKTINSKSEVLINANEFEYNKETNILIATGGVKIEDTINNYIFL